nr:hypothetical protein [Streptomyces sp. WAC04770]
MVAQAGQQVQQGSIEQACTTWGRAIDTMAGVKPTRALGGRPFLRSPQLFLAETYCLHGPQGGEEVLADLLVEGPERLRAHHLPGQRVQHESALRLVQWLPSLTHGAQNRRARAIDMVVQVSLQRHALLALREKVGVEVPTDRRAPHRSTMLRAATPPPPYVPVLGEGPKPVLRHQVVLP